MSVTNTIRINDSTVAQVGVTRMLGKRSRDDGAWAYSWSAQMPDDRLRGEVWHHPHDGLFTLMGQVMEDINKALRIR